MNTMLEKITAQFTDKTSKGTPIYKMTPIDARETLEKIQSQSAPKKQLQVNIIDMKLNDVVPIRIMRPLRSTGKLPVIIYLHGGGWILGSKYTHDNLIRNLCIKTGCAIVFVEYTLSPEAKFPTALKQAYFTLEYIYKNSDRFNFDSNNIIVAGDSVGEIWRLLQLF